jgi:hypothetical protein
MSCFALWQGIFGNYNARIDINIYGRVMTSMTSILVSLGKKFVEIKLLRRGRKFVCLICCYSLLQMKIIELQNQSRKALFASIPVITSFRYDKIGQLTKVHSK